MLELISEFDNMFRQMDAMFNYPLSSTNQKNCGLKKIIHRPHNLITRKDENGNITSYQIELVYTPFKKDQIKVSVDKNILTVKCGEENKIKDEDMDYCGVSYQSYSFSLPLSDKVVVSEIKAEADDGMLKICLPVKESEQPKSIEIAVK